MIFRSALLTDVPVISRLAAEIWWPAYKTVISDEQISFMLKDMYSEKALEEQLTSGIDFLIAERDTVPVGFAGFSMIDPANHLFKLHKIYILPSEQGNGTGKKLIAHVALLAKTSGAKLLELNVNRKNPAFGFYKKLGFEIYKVVDIPYHQFILNDYVMRKVL